MNYKVCVTETATRNMSVEISAETEEEAIDKVKTLYDADMLQTIDSDVSTVAVYIDR